MMSVYEQLFRSAVAKGHDSRTAAMLAYEIIRHRTPEVRPK